MDRAAVGQQQVHGRGPNLEVVPGELFTRLVLGVEVHRDGVLLNEPNDRRVAVADCGQLPAATSGRGVEVEQDELVLALRLL
jgi:hypothetical protein